MELLYPQEHLNCYNYENGNNPVIEILPIPINTVCKTELIDNKILFVRSGKLSYSLGSHTNQQLNTGEFIIIPAELQFTAKSLTDVDIILFRLHIDIELCERFGIEKLAVERDENDTFEGIGVLRSNEVVDEYLKGLIGHITAGLRCYYFYEIKVKELFFLLRAYYPKKELLHFFDSILSRDFTFSDFIRNNYHRVKTVKELASLTNYSVSGFEKHFKKVFGVPASQWLKKQRSKAIFHDINNGSKTFKEISYCHGFTSPSHFNDFCKSQFGATPGKIRKGKYIIEEED